MKALIAALRENWPVFSGIGAVLVALWRLDWIKTLVRSVLHRVEVANENTDLRRRFAIEAERGDYWESRCDDLERRFQEGLSEIKSLRAAIQRWKRLIVDLTIDREAAMAWGVALEGELDRHSIKPPVERPTFLAAHLNILDPLPGEEP